MDIYIIIVVVLFLLAITDLVVGVSNDAVNFLNSAIGAKAGKFKMLMLLTVFGVIIGAAFSGGMMEVARKGIFHPENFYFNEIMFIFFAVMLTDILLLDTFNTIGLPTSTTVSIVFELLGAAVAMSLIKVYTQVDHLAIAEYINTSKALAIIMGILLSVIVAFSVGAIVQWFSRLLFSFNLDKRMKYFGAILGGIAITAITYFMLIKGVKSASFMTDTVKEWIFDHTLIIMGSSFVFWTITLEILYLLFKINILRVIVLIGTMALAMAFASNDLVNFIGVPLAGFESYKIFKASAGADAGTFSMDLLAGPVKTQSYFLILAGIIMAATLWKSRKARSVVKTSVDLSRQGEGDERFGSSLLARQIIRTSLKFNTGISVIVPKYIKSRIQKQFDNSNQFADLPIAERPSFDMLRASINLIVASILISIGTSLKLPLSTTYVTFMVAMGTSLADKAWGRESAVYRITGVISVIGGWFFTAFSAFTVASIVLVIVYFGGITAIILLVLLVSFFLYRSSKSHNKKQDEETSVKKFTESTSFNKELHDNIKEYIIEIQYILENTFNGIRGFKFKKLKKCKKQIKQLNKDTVKYKNDLYPILSTQMIDFEETGVLYVQAMDYLREAVDSLKHICSPCYQHIDNNHKELSDAQRHDIKTLSKTMDSTLTLLVQSFDSFESNDTNLKIDELNQLIKSIRKAQVKRIRSKEDSTRTSILIINILQESQNIADKLNKLTNCYLNINTKLSNTDQNQY